MACSIYFTRVGTLLYDLAISRIGPQSCRNIDAAIKLMIFK